MTLTMNLRLLLLALTASLPFLSIAQVGNGVVFLTEGSFSMPDTEVGSTSTSSIQLVNTVGAAQTITISAPDSPFLLESNETLVLGAQDTTTVVLSFSPAAAGAFTSFLAAEGDVFGSAEIQLTGNGTQVEIQSDTDLIDFGNTPIGQTATSTFSLSNTGQGPGTFQLPDLSSSPFNIREQGPLISAPSGWTYWITGNIGSGDEQMIQYTRFSVHIVGPEPENAYWCVEDPYIGWANTCGYGESGAGQELWLPDSLKSNLNSSWEYYSSIQAEINKSHPDQRLEIRDNSGEVVFILEQDSEWTSGFISNSFTEVPFENGIAETTQPALYADEIEYGCSVQYSEFIITVEGTNAEDANWYFQSNYSGFPGHLTFSNEYPTNVPQHILLPDASQDVSTSNCLSNNYYDIYFDFNQADADNVLTVKDLSGNLIFSENQSGSNYFTAYSTPLTMEAPAGQIDEGESVQLVAEFNPASAGQASESTMITTNDAANPNLNLVLEGTGISDVSGEVCNATWSFEDGPINLVDDVIIPEGCSLTIDSLCTVQMNGFKLQSDGIVSIHPGATVLNGTVQCNAPLIIQGTAENPVNLENTSLISTTQTTIEHCNHPTISTSYVNDFSTNYDGWSHSSPSSGGWSSSSEHLYLNQYSSCCFTWELSSPTLQFEGTGVISGIAFELDWFVEYGNGQNCHLEILTDQTQEWVEIANLRPLGFTDSNSWFDQWITPNWDGSISIPEEYQTCSSFQFRLRDYGGSRTWYLDNVIVYCAGTRIDGYSGSSVNSESTTYSFFGGDTELSHYHTGTCLINGNTTTIEECTLNSLVCHADSLSVSGSEFSAGPDEVAIDFTGGQMEVKHTMVYSGSVGIKSNGPSNIRNSSVSGCGVGMSLNGPSNVTFSNVCFNESTGIEYLDFNFHSLSNSIVWANNSSTFSQINIENGILSGAHSNIQGYPDYGAQGGGQFSWGEGMLQLDPLFADDEFHLELFSPCVDAAQPWLLDEHMPFGLGGVRADMGIYGGPENAYWGGNPLPAGASVIETISDSPQDQGNVVGLTYSGSFYDNSELVNNVTHYAFWRHYDPTGQPISALDDGNWELIGTMPAQSFSGYAYQAATLGNTNETGPFSSCYTVVAHTADEDTYWYSNVLCGESVDNLAPDAPDLNGMVLEEGGAQVSWADPNIEDYGYTRITSDSGFEAEISADTLVVDLDALPGSTVTYTATHFDVNGNESDPSDITLVIGEAFDVIALHAGWNLISLDREPADASISALFADLIPGNLQYVTGFDEGVSFHDPSGLPFLNTLDALSPGYGYWVKVQEDDTLRAPGTPLGGGYLPALDAGWNLVAYTAETPLAPALFFGDLIANEELVYVTGFDGGVEVFDPYGLPFLNTLSELQNGFGYWVKTDADYEGMAVDGAAKATPNPNYIILNGTSNLDAHAGQSVAVVTAEGDAVAEMAILEGGHLMTTAVYGAGPSGLDGIAVGEALYLEFAGERTEAVAFWTGDMAHVKLDVQFDGPVFSVFPNPATDWIDVRFDLTESGNASVEVLDATGRLVMSQPLGLLLDGEQQVGVSTADLVPGTYQVRLTVDGRTVHTTTLQCIR